MFIHHFLYTLKTLFKNKSLVFWTFAFPIILALLFNQAFSNIEKNEMLDIINIAIVNNQEFQSNEIFQETFEELSDPNNKDQLFDTQYVNEEKAKQLLDDKEITGYLLMNEDEYKIVASTNGINETVFKSVVDEITQTSQMIQNIAEIEMENGQFNIDNIYAKVQQLLSDNQVRINDQSPQHMSYMLVEFYTLIAMTCLYGGSIVMEAMNQSLANMTSIGKRVGVSPISKGKIVLSSILASYIIQLLGVSLLMVFTQFVLKVDFGDNIPLIILLAMVGTLTGLALGLFVSVVIKANENTKVGVIIAVSMAMSVLSGMTGVVLKYMIDTHMPLINKINPASMITDGFYSLYYYQTLDKYITSIISLLVFSVIFIVISALILRRQKYDSI